MLSITVTCFCAPLQVAAQFSVPVANQLLSLTPPHDPTPVPLRPSEPLSACPVLRHGTMLYLVDLNEPAPQTAASAAATFAAASAAAAGSGAPTARCQHGPRGRCVHCAGVAPGVEVVYSGHCTHPPGAVCLHCSTYVKEGVAADKALAAAGGGAGAAAAAAEGDAAAAAALAASQPAAWLCTHPPTAFCPKCLPPPPPAADTKPKYDKTPFARVLAERARVCSGRHGPAKTCALCAPQPQPSSLGNPHCTNGHRPWPQGVCTRCAPANVNLRSQEYRHCDAVSLPAGPLQDFYRAWTQEQRRATQRAAFLFGKHIDEPAESQNPGAVRAVVAALYEPPQVRDAKIDDISILYAHTKKILHTFTLNKYIYLRS